MRHGPPPALFIRFYIFDIQGLHSVRVGDPFHGLDKGLSRKAVTIHKLLFDKANLCCHLGVSQHYAGIVELMYDLIHSLKLFMNMLPHVSYTLCVY